MARLDLVLRRLANDGLGEFADVGNVSRLAHTLKCPCTSPHKLRIRLVLFKYPPKQRQARLVRLASYCRNKLHRPLEGRCATWDMVPDKQRLNGAHLPVTGVRVFHDDRPNQPVR